MPPTGHHWSSPIHRVHRVGTKVDGVGFVAAQPDRHQSTTTYTVLESLVPIAAYCGPSLATGSASLAVPLFDPVTRPVPSW